MMNRISRRQVLWLAVMSGPSGLLAACASAPAQPIGGLAATAAVDRADAASAPTAAPAVPAAIPADVATAPTATPAAPATPAVPATPAAQPMANNTPSTQLDTSAYAQTMAGAAAKFLASLDDTQRAKTTFAFDSTERLRWHWTTPRNFPRNGLSLREMSQAQKDAAFGLLRASVSPGGFQQTLDIMSLQNDLGNDPELYYVTVFGDPEGSEAWAWRWEGHHVSRHFTVKGDRVAVTPFFHGAWPTVSSTGLRAMPREEDAARELVLSLSDAQRATAIFQPRTLTRHVTWNEAYVSPLDPVGLLAGDLKPEGQILVAEIINAYLSAQVEPVAVEHLSRLQSAGLEQVRFGWAGALEPRRPHYYRLQGPTFLLEFDNSRNGGTHIHSVWRDYAGDFGRNF